MSQRRFILLELRERVGKVKKADGYQTDAGLAVFVGETPQLGPDDPSEAIAVVPLDAEPLPNRMEIWPIEFQALVKADVNQPYLAAVAILDDIVKAVELDDRTLGGLVKQIEIGTQRTLPREPGSAVVGVVQLYRLSRTRVWGLP